MRSVQELFSYRRLCFIIAYRGRREKNNDRNWRGADLEGDSGDQTGFMSLNIHFVRPNKFHTTDGDLSPKMEGPEK